MLLRTVYTVILGRSQLDEGMLPLEVELAEGIGAVLESEDGLRLVITRSVDPSKLEVVSDSGWFQELPDGKREPLPRLRLVNDEAPERVLSADFASAVTFLSGIPLSLSRGIQEGRFVPEDEADEELLRRLCTDKPYYETGLLSGTRTFSPKLESAGVAALLDRSAGVRLYADALKQGSDVATFRDLWRVLESAFQSRDDDLVRLLAAYPPAQQMKFDETELRSLLVFRGRASHAQSKAGIEELITVEHECGRRLGRLKNLAERVILTKASWGVPTTEVNELAPLQAYIGPGGEQVYLT
jgi:hypothetical protein